MQSLRAATTLARLVLAWFVLTLGVAVASPIIQPHSVEMVCSAAGSMKLVVVDSNGEAVVSPHSSLDCPACLVVTPPTPAIAWDFEPVQPLSQALHPFTAAHIAALTGAPLPPRGPPAAA